MLIEAREALTFAGCFLIGGDMAGRVQRGVLTAADLRRVVKGLRAESVQRRYRAKADADQFLASMTYWANAVQGLPPYGSPQRTEKLMELWRNEPIMAGAVYSMSAKLASMGWKLSGEEQQVELAHDVLMNAAGGMGWTFLVEQVCQDAFGSDVGGTVELVYAGGRAKPPVVGMYALDAARVRLRNDVEYPVVYVDLETMRQKPLLADEVIRVVSLPSPREQDAGLGFCAVSRAAQMAFVLQMLWQYDYESLSDMPPNGFIAVSRISPQVFEKQLQKFKEQRESGGRFLYPGVFWLASTDDLNFESLTFRVLPEGFSRQEMVEIYAKALALAFGVDVAEFWQIEHSGATKAATTVQAKKAQGKGPAEVLSYLERGLNAKVLKGLDVTFEFDEPDDEADKMRAERHEVVVRAVTELYTAIGPTGEGILTREQALRLLVDEGVLPAEFLAEIGVDAGAVGSDTGELEGTEKVRRRRVEAAFARNMRLKELYDKGARVICKTRDGRLEWVAQRSDAPRFYIVEKALTAQRGIETTLRVPFEPLAPEVAARARYKVSLEDAVELPEDEEGKEEEIDALYDEWVEWSRQA